MNSKRTKRVTAGRLTAVLAAGLMTLGASGVASADHDRGYRDDVRVIHHHAAPVYYSDRGHHRGYKGHKRGPQIVHVYHHQPHIVERHVVVERPVYERHVVVEQPRYYQHGTNSYGNSYRGGSQLNAGALMGAAIGGLLGSQVGGGSGQLAATAAGTIGGFLVGDHTTRGYR